MKGEIICYENIEKNIGTHTFACFGTFGYGRLRFGAGRRTENLRRKRHSSFKG